MKTSVAPDAQAEPHHSAGDDEWPTAATAKGLRVRLPVALATLAATALVGVWGGATLTGDPSATPGGLAVGGPPGGAGGFPGGGFPGGGGRSGGAFPGGGVQGEVIRVEGDTVVLRGSDGKEHTVVISDSATVTETTAAAASDIRPGDTILARGTASGESTEAQAIVINPSTAGLGGGAQFPGGLFGGRPSGDPGRSTTGE